MAFVILVLFVVFLVQSLTFGWDNFTSLFLFRGDEEILMLPLQFIGIVLPFAACALFLINLVAWCNQLSRNKMVGFIVGLMVIWQSLSSVLWRFILLCRQVATVLCELWLCHPRNEDDFYATGTFTISNGCASLLVEHSCSSFTVGTSCWQERQIRGGSVWVDGFS